MASNILARDFLAHVITFGDFMAGNFLAGDFLGGYRAKLNTCSGMVVILRSVSRLSSEILCGCLKFHLNKDCPEV